MKRQGLKARCESTPRCSTEGRGTIRSREGVLYPELAFHEQAILHLLAPQCRAAGDQSAGDDHRINLTKAAWLWQMHTFLFRENPYNPENDLGIVP